jgi:K+-sensing histidine kinase KdpD
MAAHLARPDVQVEIEIIPAADFDVADTVLSYAAENSATLIVMGGYGHARRRPMDHRRPHHPEELAIYLICDDAGQYLANLHSARHGFTGRKLTRVGDCSNGNTP